MFEHFQNNFVYIYMDLIINRLEYTDETLTELEIKYTLPIYFTNREIDAEINLSYYSNYKMENIIMRMKKNSSNDFFMSPKNELKRIKKELSKKYSVDLYNIVFSSPVSRQEYITNINDDTKEPEVYFFIYCYIEFQGENMLQHMRKNKIKNILERD